MEHRRGGIGWYERYARGHGRSRPLALAGVLLATNGCAALEANRRFAGTIAGDAFAPTRPAAANYGTGNLACPAGGLYRQVADALPAAAKKTGAPEVKGDGRLCALAETFSGWTGAKAPPESLTRQVAWHFGLTGAAPRLSTAIFDTEDVSLMVEPLLEVLSGFGKTAAAPRFGLSADVLPKVDRTALVRTRVVLTMMDDALDLDAIPRALPANGLAKLSGRLLGGAANATVLSCDPAGKLQTAEQQGTTFAVDLKCGERPGVLQVEVRAEKAGAAVVLARFPIACGVPAASGFKIPPAAPADASAQERRLFDLMNAERAASGAPALLWDDSIRAVARSASTSLSIQASGQSAPFDLVAQLRQAGTVSPLVLQNPVVAASPDEASALLLTSAVNRSNALNPSATHAAVGAVVAPDRGGGSLTYFTEILIRQQPAIDVEELRGKLRASIAQKRAAAGAAALASDPILEQVAQKYAAELLSSGGALSKEREGDIIAPLYKGYRSINLVSGAKPEPLEFAEEPRVLGPSSLVGVGAAQGASPTLGKNTVYVVIIVGSKAPSK
jgi:uncharacterized protein YkwD